MRIFTLDLATSTGWALGLSDEKPRVEARRMKRPGEDPEIAADNVASFVRDVCFFAKDRPDLIVYEAPMPNFNSNDGREREIRRSQESIIMPPLMVGAVRGIAKCYGIHCVKAWPATMRKHFLGRANFGSREETKRQMILRARLLGYIPENCRDDNMADAAGLFDWAAAKFAGRASEFHLFDEGRLRHA